MLPGGQRTGSRQVEPGPGGSRPTPSGDGSQGPAWNDQARAGNRPAPTDEGRGQAGAERTGEAGAAVQPAPRRPAFSRKDKARKHQFRRPWKALSDGNGRLSRATAHDIADHVSQALRNQSRYTDNAAPLIPKEESAVSVFICEIPRSSRPSWPAIPMDSLWLTTCTRTPLQVLQVAAPRSRRRRGRRAGHVRHRRVPAGRAARARAVPRVAVCRRAQREPQDPASEEGDVGA